MTVNIDSRYILVLTVFCESMGCSLQVIGVALSADFSVYNHNHEMHQF